MVIGHTIAQSIMGLREIDPLEGIATLVPWESFRADNQAVVLTLEEAKKSKADRKAFDAIVMFRMWCCGRCKSRPGIARQGVKRGSLDRAFVGPIQHPGRHDNDHAG